MAYPSFSGGNAPIAQLNLRNRVAYTQVLDVDNTNSPPYRTASFYSYDIHGNVDTLVQDFGTTSVMGLNGNRFKTITYDYDLISGKVNQVSYQPSIPGQSGNADAFYHQYQYDAENRLTKVRTSRDRVYWQNDATYSYYRHGPLARMELGDLSVQGVDYAYTLQGWLKSINPSNVNITGDLYDADGTSSIPLFERDAYKLNLNYYDDGTYTDYMPINAPTGYVLGNGLPSAAKYNLYNGNIGSMAVSLRSVTNMAQIYNYRYDQLNRIMSMDAWDANGSFATTGTIPKPDYKEQYSYDPNGNILTLLRNGTTANSSSLAMDNLTYKYKYVKTGGGMGEYTPGQAPTTNVDHLTNQLSSVQDGVASGNYANDVDNQAALNYSYDAIGNLTKDAQAGITNIVWSVYGKILSIEKNTDTIRYTYDASGNRITKTVGSVTTSYVRDAQGNVLSVYVKGNEGMNGGAITQSEVNIYGSSRLGVLNSVVNCSGTNLVASAQSIFTRGTKLFELSNHLGNVLVTVSDKKIQHTTDNLTVDYYTPDVASANDYYPGGMQMPGRSYTSGSSSYRYGFNGKENDKDISEGAQDYGARIYDGRISRFLSIDPITKEYPWYTPYQFAGNKPIAAIDLDGLEELIKTTPVRYRVNVSGSTLHGYYKKNYSLDVYNTQLTNPTNHTTESMISFRADSDVNDDWSGAISGGTTQSNSAIENKYGAGFNPHQLNIMTLPGNKKGQSNFDAFKGECTGTGDLYIGISVNKKGALNGTIVGIIGDYGPNSQPGEQSPKANKNLLNNKNGDGGNKVIYIVFPGTAKYWEAIVGKTVNGKINRIPTNQDFINAFDNFRKDYFTNETGIGSALQKTNSSAFWKTLDVFLGQTYQGNFDNATLAEKKEALKLPKNNDRNKNN